MQIQIDNTPIHYEIIGEGFPLFILHGYLLDHEIMMGAFEPLFTERSGIQRIYADMPGMGRTPGSDELCSSEAITALMVGFLDRLLPGQRFALAGFSYGGYIARDILQRRQPLVAGMMLMSPAVESAPGIRELPESLVIVHDDVAVGLLPSEMAPLVLSTLTVQSRPVIERIVAEYSNSITRADMSFLSKLRASDGYAYRDGIDVLDPPYDGPVLILAGRHDTHVGYADAFRLSQTYPRATFAALDRAGHGVYLEQDGLFRALVHEWLDRVEETLAVAGEVVNRTP